MDTCTKNHTVNTALENADIQLQMGGYKHCDHCNAPRLGEVCWKCQGELRKPANGWTYPRCPDLNPAIAIARTLGYALSVHGSLERDIDIVATPWREGCATAELLVEAICKMLNARMVNAEAKSLGRMAYTLQVDGYYKTIDLSVSPRGSTTAEFPRLAWSEERKSNDLVHYDHVIAETPLGQILITWKGWKQHDAPTIDEHPVREVIGMIGTTVDEAKQVAEEQLFTALNKLLTPD